MSHVDPYRVDNQMSWKKILSARYIRNMAHYWPGMVYTGPGKSISGSSFAHDVTCNIHSQYFTGMQ